MRPVPAPTKPLDLPPYPPCLIFSLNCSTPPATATSSTSAAVFLPSTRTHTIPKACKHPLLQVHQYDEIEEQNHDALVRELHGCRPYVDNNKVEYVLTYLPSQEGGFGERTLVWRRGGDKYLHRHVVIASSMSIGGAHKGLFVWASSVDVLFSFGTYSGAQIGFETESAANTAAGKLTDRQSEYAMRCDRLGKYFIVDALDHLDAFLRYVNDPFQHTCANAFFSTTGELCADHHIPPFNLFAPDSSNSDSEVFACYTHADWYFKRRDKTSSPHQV